MDGRKMPSPSPTTPPIPYDFIVFTLTASKSLVECSSSVFSYIVFICVCEDEKPFKEPIGDRVMSTRYGTYVDQVWDLTLFPMGGGKFAPPAENRPFSVEKMEIFKNEWTEKWLKKCLISFIWNAPKWRIWAILAQKYKKSLQLQGKICTPPKQNKKFCAPPKFFFWNLMWTAE